MMRERTASGKRGHTTKICAAWSSVAFLHESPPLGSAVTFHDHSRKGVSLRLTLPLMSLEIVEPSLTLFMWSALRPSSVTIVKSYLGLPQFWPFQPVGIPLAPAACVDQSSMTTLPCCADAVVARASSRAASVRRARMGVTP